MNILKHRYSLEQLQLKTLNRSEGCRKRDALHEGAGDNPATARAQRSGTGERKQVDPGHRLV
jgi:hypothetical protein